VAESLSLNINVKSVLGSIAVIAFLFLITGIWLKYTSPILKIPDELFVGAAVVLGFIISMGIYSITDLGLILSFILGYIPAFLLLTLATPIGLLLLLLDFVLLIFTIAYYYEVG